MEIEIKSNGEVTILARLLLDVASGENNIASYLKDLVYSMRTIQQHYHRLISNDGQLIGQEKIELVRLMEESIQYIIIIRHVLAGIPEFSIPIPKTKYSIAFHYADDAIKGSGRIGPNVRINDGKFSLWLKNMLDKKAKKLIHHVGDAMADGELSDEERNVLIDDFNSLFIGFLLSREALLSGEMD